MPSQILNILWNWVVALVEVCPSIIKPEDVGVTDEETVDVVDHSQWEVKMIVEVVGNEAIPYTHFRGL